MPVAARRLLSHPIVRPRMDDRMGDNINGPSMIRVPPWIERPLGRYYLYFADHKGAYIRLAHAPSVEGPWRTHEAGCLDVAESLFCAERPAPPGPAPDWAKGGTDWLYPHVASPDVHVDEERRQVRMYFHGLLPDGEQMTRVALSRDGLAFEARPDLLGPSYFRVFRHGGWHYALAHPNLVLRSRDGLADFEPGPAPLDPATRHTAALVRGDALHVFWTRIGDRPERILHATLRLTGDWGGWRLSEPTEVLRPERAWEGADLAPEASRPGAVDGPVNALRDPAIFEDGGQTYLLYAGAGESAIGLAELSGL
jgi:hypothetical protein